MGVKFDRSLRWRSASERMADNLWLVANFFDFRDFS
jgi:hypothetical protein